MLESEGVYTGFTVTPVIIPFYHFCKVNECWRPAMYNDSSFHTNGRRQPHGRSSSWGRARPLLSSLNNLSFYCTYDKDEKSNCLWLALASKKIIVPSMKSQPCISQSKDNEEMEKRRQPSSTGASSLTFRPDGSKVDEWHH